MMQPSSRVSYNTARASYIQISADKLHHPSQMRKAGILALGLLASLPVLAQDEEQKPLLKRWFGKTALIRSGASTAWGWAWNRPYDWGRGASGVGARFASSVGTRMVSSSVSMGVAAWRHEDLSYQPSGEIGFKPRLRHALVSTIVARKTTTGKPTFASSRIAGTVAGGFVSRLWQPAHVRTFTSGATSSGISLGIDAGFRVAREFWPEIRGTFRRAEP
jgi:hypothetical protein